MSLLDRIAPARLGRDFRWIWGASSASNLGDGIVLAAGPLLVASITREPLAVAMAAFLQQLPWLIFGVPAGAIIDRVDRRVLVVVVDVLRFLVIGLLALAVPSPAKALANGLATEAELDKMAGELAVIVDSIASVSEAAGPEVPATSHPIPMPAIASIVESNASHLSLAITSGECES